MKKIKYSILAMAALISVACQSELEKNFPDPNYYTPKNHIVEGMFTQMMVRPQMTFVGDYAEYWYQIDGGYISYSGLTSRYNRTDYSYLIDRSNPAVGFSISTLDAYFNGPYSNYREIPLIQECLANMSAEDRTDSEIYLILATMVYQTRIVRSIDLYNSVPFFNAGKAAEKVFYASYDDPKQIYYSVLDSLRLKVGQLPQVYAQMSEQAKALFKTQDVIFDGDINKWIAYAEATRLRMAVRISGVEPDKAKEIIADVFKSNQLPQKSIELGYKTWWGYEGSSYIQTQAHGLNERDYAWFVPPLLTRIMSRDNKDEYTEGTDDPRMPAIFLPAKGSNMATGLRIFRPALMDCNKGQDNYNHKDTSGVLDRRYDGTNNQCQFPDNYLNNYYMGYNIGTYIVNKADFPIFSIAEIELLKAEIELKKLGSTGGTPEDHIYNAVYASINQWYEINARADWNNIRIKKITDELKLFLKPQKPSEKIIAGYANVIKNDFMKASSIEDKMEILMQQKFVHLNLNNPFECFTELRRTNHPKQDYLIFNGTKIKPIVNRVPYPGSEPANNYENYSKVSKEDNFTSKIFWQNLEPSIYLE